MTEPTLRHLDGLEEFGQALAFQESVWGEGFSEAVPRSIMKVTQRLGGVVAGAFLEERMVGFVFGITGLEAGRNVHWSDILAVAPDCRDLGIGHRLKRFQREACLTRGIRIMYWSYDPLESRNAYLNLGKLGAVSREYVTDMYGVSDSPLHRGLGTDRFIVTWELDSERVLTRLGGQGAVPDPDRFAHLPAAFPVDTARAGSVVRPSGGVAEGWLDEVRKAGGGRVPIPLDIQALRDSEPSLAAEWRTQTRAALRSALDAGFQVEELLRGAELSEYLLRPVPPEGTEAGPDGPGDVSGGGVGR